jgi:hypothetical protein
VQARAALIAHKLRRDPALGSTPETSILVEDAREPASLIAILACGPNGRGRYVDVAIEAVGHEDARRLVHRRAACESDGRTLDLWFDVTLAEAGKPSADL